MGKPWWGNSSISSIIKRKASSWAPIAYLKIYFHFTSSLYHIVMLVLLSRTCDTADAQRVEICPEPTDLLCGQLEIDLHICGTTGLLLFLLWNFVPSLLRYCFVFRVSRGKEDQWSSRVHFVAHRRHCIQANGKHSFKYQNLQPLKPPLFPPWWTRVQRVSIYTQRHSWVMQGRSVNFIPSF